METNALDNVSDTNGVWSWDLEPYIYRNLVSGGVSFIINIITFIALCRTRQLGPRIRVMLVSMTLNDVIFSFSCVLFTWLAFLMMMYSHVCFFWIAVTVFAFFNSCFTVTFITIDRMLALCCPFAYRRHATLARTMSGVVSCWALAFLMTTMAMVSKTTRVSDTTLPCLTYDATTSFAPLSIAVVSLLCVVAVGVMHAFIWLKIRQRQRLVAVFTISRRSCLKRPAAAVEDRARGNDRGENSRGSAATAGAAAFPRQASDTAKDSAIGAERGALRNNGPGFSVNPERMGDTCSMSEKNAWAMPAVERSQNQAVGKHGAEGARETIERVDVFKESQGSAASYDSRCHSLKAELVCASRSSQISDPAGAREPCEYAEHTEGDRMRTISMSEVQTAERKDESVQDSHTNVLALGESTSYPTHEQYRSQNTGSCSIDCVLDECSSLRCSKLPTTDKRDHDSLETGRSVVSEHPSTAACEGQKAIAAERVKSSDVEERVISTAGVERLHTFKLSKNLDTKPKCHWPPKNTTGDQNMSSLGSERNNEEQPVGQVQGTSVFTVPSGLVPLPLPGVSGVSDTSAQIQDKSLFFTVSRGLVPLHLPGVPRVPDASAVSSVSNVAVGPAWSSASETISAFSSTTIAGNLAPNLPAERSPGRPGLCCCCRSLSGSKDRAQRSIRSSGWTTKVGRAGALAVALTTTFMLAHIPIAGYIVWAVNNRQHVTFPYENNTMFYMLLVNFIESILRPLVYFWRVVGCRSLTSVCKIKKTVPLPIVQRLR